MAPKDPTRKHRQPQALCLPPLVEAEWELFMLPFTLRFSVDEAQIWPAWEAPPNTITSTCEGAIPFAAPDLAQWVCRS